MIKAILFDADNTLYKVHKEKAYEEMLKFLFKKLNVHETTVRKKYEEIIADVKKHNDPKKRQREYSLSLLLKEFGSNDPRIIKEALDIFWKYVLKDLEVLIANDKIKDLSKKYTLAIASDEFRKSLEMKLDKIFGDWKKYFKFLITPEDTNEMKPSMKYYEMALIKFKMRQDEILIVGDSLERDIEPAIRFGLKALLPEDFTKEF